MSSKRLRRTAITAALLLPALHAGFAKAGPGHVMLGAATAAIPNPPPGYTPRQYGIVQLEAEINRKFTLDREYNQWDDVFPDTYDTWTRDQGRTLVLSWDSRLRNGTPLLWSAIASGTYDSSVIIPRAKAIHDFGSLIYLAFEHEPENDLNISGSASQFANAWRHIVQVFRRNGATNVKWVWMVSAYTFVNKTALSYYPGDSFVDWIGIDGYNWFTCRQAQQISWRSFADVFDAGRVFATAHAAKPVMAAEWGSVEDDSSAGAKALWFQDAEATLKDPAWSQFQAILYFNNLDNGSGRDCDWRVETTPGSLAGFAALGNDTYYSG